MLWSTFGFWCNARTVTQRKTISEAAVYLIAEYLVVLWFDVPHYPTHFFLKAFIVVKGLKTTELNTIRAIYGDFPLGNNNS